MCGIFVAAADTSENRLTAVGTGMDAPDGFAEEIATKVASRTIYDQQDAAGFGGDG